MDEKKRARTKFILDPRGWAARASMILMGLAIVLRILGCWGLWSDRSFALWQIALPIAAGLLFILFVLLFGKRALWTTALPVWMGVVFFIAKSLGFESVLHTVLCILLYTAVAILYGLTVFGILPTKLLLLPLFGLPFLYHVFVEDLAALQNTAEPLSFSAGVQEMSVLCIMLALFFAALGMKKFKPELPGDLPKMKAPKVLPPERLREQPEQPEETGDAT